MLLLHAQVIPHMAEGSWVIKQSVGTTPVLIAHKLTTTYHFNPSYVEVAVDIGSNSTANYITGESRHNFVRRWDGRTCKVSVGKWGMQAMQRQLA